MKPILLILVIWFLFLSDLTFTVSNKKNIYTINWNGIVWVLLDWYLIIKYHSADKPMGILSYKKESIINK